MGAGGLEASCDRPYGHLEARVGEWEALRDIVQNSCPYDTPILVLRNGKVSLVPIGKFVEDNLDNDREGICKGETYVLAFDPTLTNS